MFCFGFIRIRVTFDCDLQHNFKENAKALRYCNAKLNVISEVLRDGECGLGKPSPNANKTLFINQTFRIC